MTAAAIAASTSSTLQVGSDAPWRNECFITNDGFRVVFYTDGTSLFVKSSQGGGTWNAPVSLIPSGVTGLGKGYTFVYTGTAFYILYVSGTSINWIVLPYNTAGAFGTPSVPNTLVGTLPGVAGSLVAQYDAQASTSLSTHTTGLTGVIYLLLDSGGTWTVYVLDPNASGTLAIASTTTIPTGINVPTYQTNMIVLYTGAVYIASSTNEGRNVACQFKWNQSSAQNGNTGPSSLVITEGSTWFSTYTNNKITLNGSSYYGLNTLQSSSTIIPVAFGSPTTGSGMGYTYSSVAGLTYDGGLWTFTLNFNSQHVNMSGAMGVRIYDGVGGALLQTVPPGPTVVIGYGSGSTSGALTCSTTLGSFTLAHNLYIEPYFVVSGNSEVAGTMAQCTITFANGTISTPTPRGAATTVTTWNGQAGNLETPTLACHPKGMALLLTNYTANCSVDLFTFDVAQNQIVSQRRDPSGQYSAVTSMGGYANGHPAANQVPCAALDLAHPDVTGGNASLVYCTTNNHIAYISRTNGTWGLASQLDSQTAAIGLNFCTSSILQGGTIAIYQNSPSAGNYQIMYDDGGTASVVAPTAPTNLGIYGAWGTPNLQNVAMAYAVSQGQDFTITGTFNCASKAQMSAYYFVLSRWNGSAYVTQWTSALYPMVNGPTNGGQFSVNYPNSQSVAAVVMNTTALDQITMVVYESLGNSGSPASAPIGAIAYTPPTVGLQIGATLSTGKPAFSVSYQDSQNSRPCSFGQVNIFSLAGALLYSSPYLPVVGASGTTLTFPSVDLTPYVKNHTAYIAQTRCFYQAFGQSYVMGYDQKPVTFELTLPPQPVSVLATPVRGTTPTAGGLVRIQFSIPSPGGGLGGAVYGVDRPGNILIGTADHPVAPLATPTGCNIYGRPSPGTAPNNFDPNLGLPDGWVKIGSTTQATANGAAIIYVDFLSAPHNVPWDYAVSTTAPLVESIASTYGPVNLQFRAGLWFNDPTNPKGNCVELGILDSSASQTDGGQGVGQLLEYQRLKQLDSFLAYNQSLPHFTRGPAYAKQLRQPQSYLLDQGYEQTMIATLESLDRNATLVQIRDAYGKVFWGRLVSLTDTSDTLHTIRAVTVDYQESQAGTWTGKYLLVDNLTGT